MATTFQYNGIDLGLVRTVKVDQKAEYDPSNTDLLFVTNRFVIRAVLSEGVSGVTRVGAGDGPAARMATIRHLLLQPRKPFLYQATDEFGTVDLVKIDEGFDGQALDADNGPKPISCDIIQVSEETWIIDYVIDVSIKDCNAHQDFASNRFEVTHDIDDKGYSTITTLGRVFVRSDMRVSPDTLRWVVTPPLPKGFKRKSMYQVHEDGLSMAYRITDTEMFLAPPAPAMAAKGRFSIITMPPGAIMYAQVDVTLEGRKKQSKRELMEMAILLALKRLQAGGAMRDPRNQGRVWVESGAVSEELFENSVSVSLRSRVAPPNSIVKESDNFKAFDTFWAWFFFGLPGVIAKNPALSKEVAKSVVGTNALSVGAAVASVVSGAKEAMAAVGIGSAGNSKTEPPHGPNDPPAKKDTAPATSSASYKNIVERFGTRVEGATQWGRVNPGLGGNLKFMGYVAAAFRDPCVVDAALKAAAGGIPLAGTLQSSMDSNAATGSSVGVSYSGQVVPLASWSDGGQQGITAATAGWTSRDERFQVGQLAAHMSSTDPTDQAPNPALDWANLRLGRIVNVSPVDGQLIMSLERALPEEEEPVPPADNYLGWYEEWYCEVRHDIDHYATALPATVQGLPAVACRMANPLRTLRVGFAARKAMFPPEMPMIVGDTNVLQTHAQVSLPNMEMGADGKTPIFSIDGYMEYKVLDETYVQMSFPVPPWLALPMRQMPGPIPRPDIVVTGGGAGAVQDAIINPLLTPLPPAPPGAGA